MERQKFIEIYCQLLINNIGSDISLTKLADLLGDISHDSLNKQLKFEKIGPEDVWGNVSKKIEQDDDGIVAIDDTVIKKEHSEKIELVYRLFSAGAIILGIGIIFLLYINSKTKQIYVIDFRIYNKNKDKKTKIQHAMEMLSDAVNKKNLKFKYVTMDKWYSAYELMLHIDSLNKIYYCPLKTNRMVSEKAGLDYVAVENLKWNDYEFSCGKRGVKLRNFPKEKLVTIFQIFPTAEEVAYLATNDSNEERTRSFALQIYRARWSIEVLHRELKQLVNIGNCQCRKEAIQRNHIACAAMAWNFLRSISYKTDKTVNNLKKDMYRAIERILLENPILKFA